MFTGEALYALQFDNQHVFHQDVGIVFSDVLALVVDRKRRLGRSPDPSESEFPQQGTSVDFLQETGF